MSLACHVCSCEPDSQLSFYCPTCARNQLYTLRFDLAKTLLGKEAAGQKIEQAVKDATQDLGLVRSPVQPEQPRGERSKITVETLRTLKIQAEIRSESIQVQIAKLRREIESGKQEIAKRRAALAKRRSDAESARYQLPDRRATTVNNVQKDIRKRENAWNSLHTKTAESRMFLCREVARLYNLRQKSRRKNGKIITTYSIGGVYIVDPRDMNSASPAQITTSLSHIARLLVLVSRYLALRLPAEITLPHREYPLPTILAPSSSYIEKDIPFSAVSPSSSVTPRSAGARAPPRPRPLFLQRNLPKLAKEDPAGYALFIEAVALLAWDVSWICRSQGLYIGSESWEDVCDMGQNLWQLLVAPPALVKALGSRDGATKVSNGKEATRGRTTSASLLGHYSHGTVHSFLGNNQGLEFMKTWKLPSYIKIADKLKSTLLSEMATAEWEILEEEEWEDDPRLQKQGEQPSGPIIVDVPPSNPENAGEEAGRIIMTASAIADSADAPQVSVTTPNDKAKGTKGWTKINSR
ncbi:hypothetical protein LOZ12_003729 [Ophidiomyces ophidiicola]|uniref:Uncharacterized protein n=1 Tax=Ophidiomyces ophidiicola TaxID=1387563 RepID=A0ACB8UXM6_9EURO|nr:hypothetical protein LOZ64_006242 [Ophidiomyces ophidiicola]KAI1946221.1 hypothetical protein LOZ62_003441 [Ophidiomyces ophidiicola]KAI2038493.1 hypothetical protein LOZ47_003169 [Ophidiomyces ophidiicola]KAI2044013.1 hypothetical protein LOZ38_006482 [Ophidiomyces ophidiicola]KAI2074311.1 hypothetical protein LOZ37_003767 [Ophidiomyces ophidiicola]